MHANLEATASTYVYKTNYTTLPLNIIDKFRGMETDHGDVALLLEELRDGNRDVVLGSMAAIYLSIGYFEEVNFNRVPLFDNSFVFKVRPIHLARVITYFDNEMSDKFILENYASAQSLNHDISITVFFQGKRYSFTAGGNDSVATCLTACKADRAKTWYVYDMGKVPTGGTRMCFNILSNFGDYNVDSLLNVMVLDKVPGVTATSPKVPFKPIDDHKSVDYRMDGIMAIIISSIKSRDGYRVHDVTHMSRKYLDDRMIEKGRDGDTIYNIYGDSTYDKLCGEGGAIHDDIHWIMLTTSQNYKLFPEYYKYDLGFGTVYSNDRHVFAYTLKKHDDSSVPINIHYYNEYDTIVFLGAEAQKAKSWCQGMDPYNKKKYHSDFVFSTDKRLIVIDKYVPPEVELCENDIAYNLELKQLMNDVTLNKMLPYFGTVHPAYLLRIGFNANMCVMGHISAEGMCFPYSHNNVDTRTTYLIPSFQLDEYKSDRGHVGMGQQVVDEMFDHAYRKIKFLACGTADFKYSETEMTRHNHVEINKNFEIKVNGSFAVKDLCYITLPRLFSTGTAAKLTGSLFIGSYMLLTYLDTLPDLKYNEEFDLWYNPHGKKRVDIRDVVILNGIVFDMAMQPVDVCKFLFNTQCKLDCRMEVIKDNFDAAYAKLTYACGDYIVMSEDNALKTFSRGRDYVGSSLLQGMRNKNDIPLVRVKGDLYLPTWIYMSL